MIICSLSKGCSYKWVELLCVTPAELHTQRLHFLTETDYLRSVLCLHYLFLIVVDQVLLQLLADFDTVSLQRVVLSLQVGELDGVAESFAQLLMRVAVVLISNTSQND